MRGRPSAMSCPVGQDHIALALARLAIGPGPMVADQRLGVGLRRPFNLSAASEPSQHCRLLFRLQRLDRRRENSIIGSAACHMAPKCASKRAAALAIRMTIRS